MVEEEMYEIPAGRPECYQETYDNLLEYGLMVIMAGFGVIFALVSTTEVFAQSRDTFWSLCGFSVAGFLFFYTAVIIGRRSYKAHVLILAGGCCTSIVTAIGCAHIFMPNAPLSAAVVSFFLYLFIMVLSFFYGNLRFLAPTAATAT